MTDWWHSGNNTSRKTMSPTRTRGDFFGQDIIKLSSKTARPWYNLINFFWNPLVRMRLFMNPIFHTSWLEPGHAADCIANNTKFFFTHQNTLKNSFPQIVILNLPSSLIRILFSSANSTQNVNKSSSISKYSIILSSDSPWSNLTQTTAIVCRGDRFSGTIGRPLEYLTIW